MDRGLIENRSDVPRPCLVCRIESRFWCLPIDHVVETMRPLPVEPLGGGPPYVRGLSMIRGAPVPVLDTRLLLGLPEGEPARFVLVQAGRRTVALAVDEVVGVDRIATDELGELPSILREAGDGVVSLIGSRDGELLLVLQSTRLVPDAVWTDLLGDERS
jgi:purine-binding chemotaxis protein CheW